METGLPVAGVVPIRDMLGDDEDDTRLLREMAETAQQFITSFSWCKSIKNLYFGDGIGGIIGIFFVHIEPDRPEVDEWLWVIVGDLPPAYLVADDSCNPQQAAEAYISQMRAWVASAKTGQVSDDIIPVNVPATPEWAAALETRLNTLQFELLPQWFTR